MMESKALNILRTQKFESVKKTLEKQGELIAFIIAYGSYDPHYMSFVSIINRVSDSFLTTRDATTIDKLYDVYTSARAGGKSNGEVFITLREVLSALPYLTVNGHTTGTGKARGF